MEEEILLDILEAREIRRNKQVELIKRYKSSLVSFTLNIPGREKNRKIYREIHKEGMKSILKALKSKDYLIRYKEEVNKDTGREGYIVVDSHPIKLKEIGIAIEENHSLGRIFDIDVFDLYHRQISRKDLGLDPRTCLLCENNARKCIRLKNHSYRELIDEINRIWKEYKETYKTK